MKNSFAIIALLAAVGAPSAFAAELFGLHLPWILNSSHIFTCFVAAAMLLIVFRDYTPPPEVLLLTSSNSPAAVPAPKAAHPLAA